MQYFYLFILLLFFSLRVHSQSLNIKISNIDHSKGGQLLISIFNSDEGFLDDEGVIAKQKTNVNASSCIIHFNKLEKGTYAVLIAHDEDSNGELNANFIGIPTEGWGFSTNPKLMGPPTWDKTKFEFKEDGQAIGIRINY